MMDKSRRGTAFANAVDDVNAEAGILTDRTVAHVYEELSSYASVPVSRLRASVQRNLDRAVRTLRTRSAPHPDELPEAEVTARERVRHGVPIEDMMRAYRINIGVVESRFVERAFQIGVAPQLVLEGSRLLWSVADAFTTRLALAYQEAWVENALHDSHRRSAFVRELLAGSIETGALVSQCALYGIDPSAKYAAVRARGRVETDIEPLRRQLERHGSTDSNPALIAVVSGDLAGIVASPPEDVDHLVVGVGASTGLLDIAASFRTASRVLEAACLLGKQGAFTLEDLSWRLAVVDEPEVGSYLLRRYLIPLRQHGEFGQLLEDTLRTYLDSGHNVARAAAKLVVHENTLRHRLHKFTELTGASLASTDVIIELAWALEARRVEDARHGGD